MIPYTLHYRVWHIRTHIIVPCLAPLLSESYVFPVQIGTVLPCPVLQTPLFSKRLTLHKPQEEQQSFMLLMGTQRLLCVFTVHFWNVSTTIYVYDSFPLLGSNLKWSEFSLKCSEIWCVNVNNQEMHNICYRSVLKIKYLQASTMTFLLLTARQLSKPILYCEYAPTLF